MRSRRHVQDGQEPAAPSAVGGRLAAPLADLPIDPRPAVGDSVVQRAWFLQLLCYIVWYALLLAGVAAYEGARCCPPKRTPRTRATLCCILLAPTLPQSQVPAAAQAPVRRRPAYIAVQESRSASSPRTSRCTGLICCSAAPAPRWRSASAPPAPPRRCAWRAPAGPAACATWRCCGPWASMPCRRWSAGPSTGCMPRVRSGAGGGLLGDAGGAHLCGWVAHGQRCSGTHRRAAVASAAQQRSSARPWLAFHGHAAPGTRLAPGPLGTPHTDTPQAVLRAAPAGRVQATSSRRGAMLGTTWTTPHMSCPTTSCWAPQCTPPWPARPPWRCRPGPPPPLQASWASAWGLLGRDAGLGEGGGQC